MLLTIGSALSASTGLTLAAVLGSSLLAAIATKALDRSASHVQAVREGYAEATRAIVAWGRFPYRVERRVDDLPETRRALEALGSDIQERLAYYVGWVSSESPDLGTIYGDMILLLRTGVGRHAQRAWHSPPRESAAAMSLPPGKGDLRQKRPEWTMAQLFGLALRYRFGWRRYLLPPLVVQHLLRRARVIEKAEALLQQEPWHLQVPG